MSLKDNLVGIGVKQFEGVNYSLEMVEAMKRLMGREAGNANHLISLLDEVTEFIQDSGMDEDAEICLDMLRNLSVVRRAIKPFRDGMILRDGDMFVPDEITVYVAGQTIVNSNEQNKNSEQ